MESRIPKGLNQLPLRVALFTSMMTMASGAVMTSALAANALCGSRTPQRMARACNPTAVKRDKNPIQLALSLIHI